MGEAKRCLVTGGAGFIGSHIVDRLLDEGHTVSILDNLSSGKRENIPANVPLYPMDLSDDLTPLFMRERPEIVFHQAAHVSVSVSVREPAFDAKTNILGSINLLEACRKFGVKRVVYASSGAVYGEPQSLPLREDHSTLGISPYGISKWVVERYLYYYRHQFGIEFVALRYANVYGPRQDPHGEAGVVAIFSQKLLNGEEAVIFGDGEQTRDYVYVKDVAWANWIAMDVNLPSQLDPAFNVSTQIQTTVNVIFDQIKQHTGFSRPRQYGPFRAGDVTHACLSNEKIAVYFGWKPEITIDEGLKETVEFFKARKT